MYKTKMLGYVFSLLVLLVIGCSPEESPDETPGEEEQVKSDEVVKDQEIMDNYRAVSMDMPEPNVLIQLIDENIAEVSTKNADEMVETLRNSLEINRQHYGEDISELDTGNELLAIDGLETMFNESSISEIKNEELTKRVQYLYDNFYQLINLEGEFYPVVDYSKLKNYEKYLGEEFQLYLEIKSLELNERSMTDGELVISFNELAERIYKEEDYFNIAEPSERMDDILRDYDYKVNAYLKGLPNTPIMEDATNKIKENVLTSYQESAAKNYVISTATNNYLDILEGNEYVVNEAILQEADALIIKVITTIDVK